MWVIEKDMEETLVSRLSKGALQKLLSGKVKQPASVIVKFYSNGCHYCAKLKEDFEQIAITDEAGRLFFAFNIADYPPVQDILNFRGVPTICVMKIGDSKPRIKVMPEPSKPNKETWYNKSEITSFIETEG